MQWVKGLNPLLPSTSSYQTSWGPPRPKFEMDAGGQAGPCSHQTWFSLFNSGQSFGAYNGIGVTRDLNVGGHSHMNKATYSHLRSHIMNIQPHNTASTFVQYVVVSSSLFRQSVITIYTSYYVLKGTVSRKLRGILLCIIQKPLL